MEAYNIALTLYGTKEIAGKEDNPVIIQMFNDLGYNGKELKDETSWCAAFANWCLMVSGHKHTGKLNARSFLSLQEKTEEPQLGDIVVFWRESPDSWKGHVGFYITERNGWTYVLGGNQSNEVNIKAYQTSRVLGYRKPQRLSL